MLLLRNNLDDLFLELSRTVKCREVTRSYISSIFKDVSFKNNFSKNSITLLYADAHNNFNFSLFKDIGDWLFLTKSIFPDHLKNASDNYYNSIAQKSYYNCYVILRREWKLFEELADQFPKYTKIINNNFNSFQSNQILLNDLYLDTP